ncbi:MAG: polysaccharide biosynthesis protein [Candidatus Binatia bacterium]
MNESHPKVTASLARWIVELPRDSKRAIMLLADVTFIPLTLWLAVALKVGAVEAATLSFWLYAVALGAAIPVFARLGLYRAVVRFIGPAAMGAVLAGVTTSVLLLVALNATVMRRPVPYELFVIYWALALLYVGGSRFAVRALMHSRPENAERVIIYGAGAAGAQLASALLVSGRYFPVAFVDDNPSLYGSLVNGIQVYGPRSLDRLVKASAVNAVLLALPSQSRKRRQEILKLLEPLPVKVQTVPDIGDIVNGNATVSDLRDVDAADLLGRDPVPPNPALLDACIRNKVVMVTGAGGSIGSELCRQILQLGPTRLVLLEMSELALYSIERELGAVIERDHINVELVALLGNAHHRKRIFEVVQTYGVQTIYHAAAYKHVPIVEQNVIQGIHNNVFSTWHAAEAALDGTVETFVLISTDKAVNPTNVMGATKRFAEIVLQGIQERTTTTRFCMVRFGNVLESSGSVVPLFREQIRTGGPVTVTHKDVIRYFMTIPEAAQLVLQAGAMGKGGDVFVLDMGKPVRIDDLARRMVRLMGLSVRDEKNPDGDIEIDYVGLRPAEKLFEELLIGTNVAGTEHPMIMRAIEHRMLWRDVQHLLDEMLEALNRNDCDRAREILMKGVVEYRPGEGLQDHVWVRKGELAQLKTAGNVADFQAHRISVRRSPGDGLDRPIPAAFE